MKKITPIVLFLCCFWGNTEAQIFTNFSEVREFNDGFQAGLGYHQSTFLNSQFGTMMKEGYATRKVGASINLRFTYLPFMVDLAMFNSNFRAENNPNPQWTFADTARIKHVGAEIAISVPLIPRSKYVVPYAGLGFQTGAFGVNINTFGGNADEVDEEDVSSVKIDLPIWKAGVMLNFGQKIVGLIEYKKTLSSNHEFTFNQLAVILTYRWARTPY